MTAMTAIYIIGGIVLYFLIAGIIGGLFLKYVDEDAELLVIFLSSIWPIALPFYILCKIYFLGKRIIEKPLNKNQQSTDK